MTWDYADADADNDDLLHDCIALHCTATRVPRSGTRGRTHWHFGKVSGDWRGELVGMSHLGTSQHVLVREREGGGRMQACIFLNLYRVKKWGYKKVIRQDRIRKKR